MKIVGLTGSIGMGKSTAAAMLRRMGVPVDSADEAVHRLMKPGGRAFRAVAAAFPEALRHGRIDRARLGGLVFGDAAALKRLEAILHPLVAGERRRFLATSRRAGRRLVVLDIPLLFEKHLENQLDAVIVVTAPAFVQRARVLARPGMSPPRLEAILKLQMPDREKRRRAGIVIPTGGGLPLTLRRLQQALKRLDCASHARNRSRYRNHRR